MKLLQSVLLFRAVFLAATLRTFFFLMLHRFLLVLKQWVQFVQNLSRVIQQFRPARARFSQLLLITRAQLQSMFFRVSVKWQARTVHSDVSTLRAFHLHHAVFHRLKLHSISMRTVLFTFQQKIWEQAKSRVSALSLQQA